jgi:hypothetical protein
VEHSEDHLLSVPVRSTTAGTLSVRTGRLEGGDRVGIAFTSDELLVRAYGRRQRSVRLHVSALRALLRPLGVTRIQVDPTAVVSEAALRLGERSERMLLQAERTPVRVPAQAGAGGGHR